MRANAPEAKGFSLVQLHSVAVHSASSGVLVFFRSRSLGEGLQRPYICGGYGDVSCSGWILCLLDYDHCAAGGVFTILVPWQKLHCY